MCSLKHLFALLLFVCLFLSLQAQYITHGPAIGGLKPNSVRMYLRTSFASSFTVQLSEDSMFSKTRDYIGQTLAQNDTTSLLTLHWLEPNTLYYYRVMFNGQLDMRMGSFTTAPPIGKKGHYVFATGSCQETPNMKVFDAIPLHQPRLFLHTGDWTYPSYQLDNSYPTNYNTVKKAWRKHYEEDRMKDMLLTVPIDYVPDDDDGFGPSRDFWWGVGFSQDPVTDVITNYFTHDTITQIMRSNVMKGYTDFFPGYTELPDTSIGLYHSFEMGNCKFIFLDTRSFADVPTKAYQYDANTNLWSFNPPAGHKLLGDKQMQWLKDELKNATADWKFLVMGVPFNKNLRLLIDFALNYQQLALSIAGVNGTGFRLSAGFAGYWAGFPEEQNDLLDFIAANELKDIIVVSGDTHHNVMDDGTNAGLPEINASGLSVTGTNLAYFLDLFGQLIPNAPSMQNEIWNGGGNGLGNNNFKNAFGKIEVFNADSVKLYIIDEDNEVISAITIPHSGKTFPEPEVNNEVLINVYPVPPQGGNIVVQLNPDYQIFFQDRCYLTDMAGRQVAEISVSEFIFNTALLNIDSDMPHGAYLLVYEHGKDKSVKKILLP